MSLAASDAIAALREAARERTPACDAPPDVTSAAHWSGACAGATLWALFILYAASRGAG